MSTLCFGCMQQKENSPVCEHCGWDENQPNLPHQLPIGTILQNQYLVGRVLGQGGFGITYMGWDQHLSIPVAIKEYYPGGVVQRHTSLSTNVSCATGEAPEVFAKHKERFLKEARALAQLSDIPQIVEVKNYFSENGTAYIVMEYVEGITLKDHLKKLGRSMSDKEALEIMDPVLQALQKVHDHGLIHRDISPDNIMLPQSGGIKLIDFGTVRYMDESGKSKSTEAILKPGFAPIEQYNSRGNLGTWTDVYAICATFHYLLTGRVPEDAHSRMVNGEQLSLLEGMTGLSENLITVLEEGMRIRSRDRLQTIAQLRDRLYSPGYSEIQTSLRRNTKKVVIAVAAVLAVIAAAGLFARKVPTDIHAGSEDEKPKISAETIAIEPTENERECKYIQAEEFMENQQYSEALEIWLHLDGYRDSSEKAEECRLGIAYSEAERLYEAKQTARAAMAFYGLGDYQDSRERCFRLWEEALPFQTISAGTKHIVGLKEDGTVIAQGDNSEGQCNVEGWTDIVSVAAGDRHTVGLKADGTVVAVGNIHAGQCNVSDWTDMVAIYASPYRTAGLRADGTVRVVGYHAGNYGEFDTSDWTDIVAVCLSINKIMGLKADGTVVAEGWHDAFHKEIQTWQNVTSLSAGVYCAAAVKNDGTCYIIGPNGKDRQIVESWTGIQQIYIGGTGFTENNTYVIGQKADGTLVGAGYWDQLYAVLAWEDILALSTSDIFGNGIPNAVIAQKADGTVVGSWGYDLSGWTDIRMP